MFLFSTWTSVLWRIVASSLFFSCLSATPAYAQQSCPPFSFDSAPPVATERATNKVTFELQAGLLKPQIERLLARHFDVQELDWQASPHYRWSTDFTLTAANWDLALEKLLTPYQLHLTLYANHSAVVRANAGARP
ncbi:hypothetical protein PSI9734_00106 [Pseudidiomarina piscicola]|uniref:Toxin co-regulated pilus biosynthesis protein Q C-terminal domain-containing protein n=1 Tax=Pseudidiomarina piscicola TaxID=2614830 RepID=A0A6S6WIR8_9GAMM|nr:hypothetical protein [Pseudidiomarina piscicola]CAB0149542.1 hypothetical protein PSI9734_00106 [Pseudidiomarina piscicola]VZT38990.1 hypothetical protein PSI9734_00106 [Pseudomonas aeruginosa]